MLVCVLTEVLKHSDFHVTECYSFYFTLDGGSTSMMKFYWWGWDVHRYLCLQKFLENNVVFLWFILRKAPLLATVTKLSSFVASFVAYQVEHSSCSVSVEFSSSDEGDYIRVSQRI